MDYRYGSHTVFQIEYHFVWVMKYRYKVLTAEVAERVRELVGAAIDASFRRRVSALPVLNPNPPASAGGCLVFEFALRLDPSGQLQRSQSKAHRIASMQASQLFQHQLGEMCPVFKLHIAGQ